MCFDSWKDWASQSEVLCPCCFDRRHDWSCHSQYKHGQRGELWTFCSTAEAISNYEIWAKSCQGLQCHSLYTVEWYLYLIGQRAEIIKLWRTQCKAAPEAYLAHGDMYMSCTTFCKLHVTPYISRTILGKTYKPCREVLQIRQQYNMTATAVS